MKIQSWGSIFLQLRDHAISLLNKLKIIHYKYMYTKNEKFCWKRWKQEKNSFKTVMHAGKLKVQTNIFKKR